MRLEKEVLVELDVVRARVSRGLKISETVVFRSEIAKFLSDREESKRAHSRWEDQMLSRQRAAMG